MNPHSKLTQFQITLHGHAIFITPEPEELFYCFEVENEEHTHIGLKTKEPISKKELIHFIASHNELEHHQVQVNSHKNWGTIWGYHYGFGDKLPCGPEPVWITKAPEDVKTMVFNRRMHKKLDTNHAFAAQTNSLLEITPAESLRAGYIALRGFAGFVRDYTLATELLAVRPDVPLAPKKRHFWFYGPSNTGKSTRAKTYGNYYVVPRNNDWKYYNHEKVLILEEFKGKAPWTVDCLQELCDADGYTVNTKGGSKRLDRDVIVIITARLHPNDVFHDEDPQDRQGILNRFNIELLSHVYP